MFVTVCYCNGNIHVCYCYDLKSDDLFFTFYSTTHPEMCCKDVLMSYIITVLQTTKVLCQNNCGIR